MAPTYDTLVESFKLRILPDAIFQGWLHWCSTHTICSYAHSYLPQFSVANTYSRSMLLICIAQSRLSSWNICVKIRLFSAPLTTAHYVNSCQTRGPWRTVEMQFAQRECLFYRLSTLEEIVTCATICMTSLVYHLGSVFRHFPNHNLQFSTDSEQDRTFSRWKHNWFPRSISSQPLSQCTCIDDICRWKN